MKKVKKRVVIIPLLILLIISLIVTNPTKKEYKDYAHLNEERMEKSFGADIDVRIERINFFLFSTYTPFVLQENGITHLGLFGHFFQISDGQFDYPWWLELFSNGG